MGGGSPKVVHTIGGGLGKGVLGVYKGGGWVKKGQKSAYVICTQPLSKKILPMPTIFQNVIGYVLENCGQYWKIVGMGNIFFT